MVPFNKRTLIILLMVAWATLSALETFAQDAMAYRNLAKMFFETGKYQNAVVYLKKYLETQPKDFDSWSMLGASYFHTGLPEKGLKILKQTSRSSRYKSFNYYYQGLCYIVLEDLSNAQKYLASTAKYRDIYASYAMAELAVIEYEQRDFKTSLIWIEQYLATFPGGMYAYQMYEMKDSIGRGEFLTSLNRTTPDIQKALYKYNKFSLMNYPHFWFLRSGYQIENGSYKMPKEDKINKVTTLEDDPFVQNYITASGGFGLGPIKQLSSITHLGYNYFQNWTTSYERLEDYSKDYSDLQYFPFRFDLLQRSHQLYADVKKSYKNVSIGVNAKYELTKMGSALFSSAEDHGLRDIVNISTVSKIIPWVKVNYSSNYSTSFYLFMRKEIDHEQSEYSNKTYVSPLGSGTPMFSGGIIQKVAFPQIRSEFNAELFRYQTIYNDYWLDNIRTGGLLGSQWHFNNFIKVTSILGYYQDFFEIEHIRYNTCSGTQSTTSLEGGRKIKKCPREDNGMLAQIGVDWYLTPFHAISGYYRYESAENPQFPFHDSYSHSGLISLTLTFPSLDAVMPFVDRLEDQAFKKEVR